MHFRCIFRDFRCIIAIVKVVPASSSLVVTAVNVACVPVLIGRLRCTVGRGRRCTRRLSGLEKLILAGTGCGGATVAPLGASLGSSYEGRTRVGGGGGALEDDAMGSAGADEEAMASSGVMMPRRMRRSVSVSLEVSSSWNCSPRLLRCCWRSCCFSRMSRRRRTALSSFWSAFRRCI